MKKWLRTGCLVGLTGLASACLAVQLWMQYPTAKHQTELGQILQRQQKLQQEFDSRRQDKAKNLWQDPAFAKSQIGAAELMGEFSALAKGENVHLRQKLDSKEPKLVEALAKFEPFYDQLHQALNRVDNAVETRESQSWDTAKKVMVGLHAYTEVLAVQGREARAQAVALDTLRLANLMDAGCIYPPGYLHRKMVQEQALLMTEVVLRDTDCNDQGLKTLAERLASARVPTISSQQCLEWQIYNADAQIVWFSPANTPEFLMEKIPQLRQREVRRCHNQMVEAWLAEKAGRPVLQPDNPRLDWVNWLKGTSPFEFATSVRDLTKDEPLLELRRGLNHLVVYCRLYQEKTGHWPGDVTQLAEVGYQPLANLEPNAVKLAPLQVSYPKPANLREGFVYPSRWETHGQELVFTSPSKLR